MSDTPEAWDTAKIREAFIYDGGEADYYDPINGAKEQRRIAGDIFDRWLAAHDAEVRDGVVAEEPEWEYAWELRESDTGDFFDRGLEQLNRAQAIALGDLRAIEENRASPDEPPLSVIVVRRRKAGEWEPAG